MTKLDFTRTQNVGTLSISAWTKISSLEFTIFELQNDGKKWSRIYFDIHRAPSEIKFIYSEKATNFAKSSTNF